MLTQETYQNSGYRHPALSNGRVHMFNNFIRHWSAYGSRSERNGRLFIENNVYEADPASQSPATRHRPQGVPENGPPAGTDCSSGQSCVAPYKNVCGCNDHCTQCDPTPGTIKGVGNLMLNDSGIEESQPQTVCRRHHQRCRFLPVCRRAS